MGSNPRIQLLMICRKLPSDINDSVISCAGDVLVSGQAPQRRSQPTSLRRTLRNS